MPRIPLCLFLVIPCLAFGFSARAERCSIEGHQSGLSDFYEAAIKKSLATLPQKAGFAMNPDSLDLQIEYRPVSDDEYLPFPNLEITGSFLSEKGTELDILVKSENIHISYHGDTSELQNNDGDLIFTTSLSSKGRDREGNPVQPRCRLSTKAWFTIRNHANGRILTRFELPSSITINTEKR